MSEAKAPGRVSGQANDPLSLPPHALPFSEVIAELSTDASAGLSAEELGIRQARHGANDLEEEKGVQPLEVLIAQVANAMTMVLLLALGVSFAIQAWIEGSVLAVLILVNVVVGFMQDLQAARTIASLKSLNSPTARAIRDGVSIVVKATTLVPGDIIELKTGDSVPADARLVTAINLEADEALLTGESVPVRKDPLEVFDEDTGPGDRRNVVYSSSIITKGRGQAVVFATGMCTEIGAIAAALRDQGGDKRQLKRNGDGEALIGAYVEFLFGRTWDWLGTFLGVTVGTPLQRKLARLFLCIFAFALLCGITVLGANSFRARNDVIIYAVAVAIGTLPVTLILVLTITMAAGTKAMVQRNVVVRNMRSLEALGGVTNICSDKTGTLTQGKMVARMAWIPYRGTYTVDTSQDPFNPEVGQLTFTEQQPSDMMQNEKNGIAIKIESEIHPALDQYLKVAAFANLATLQKSLDDGAWKATGDPTEIALRVFAARFGKMGLADDWIQLAEFPFDSSIKRMSVVCHHQPTQATHIFTKGAVERVIDICSTVSSVNGIVPLTAALKDDILSNMEALARRGLRILALAGGTCAQFVSAEDARQGRLQRDVFEKSLTFHGLIGIYDPPRPESRPSVFKCHQAGIGVHMLTGDHPETARTIAIDVGILPSRMELLRADIARNIVMTAHDFDRLSDTEIDALPELPLVVARCAPSTKVRMIDALRRRGRYVAMTGDGVNDSPSLKRADVGIAMGQGGSDVAKSASDIVLSDDNFASILNAVEEGRRIFDNVQKFMLHVLAANVAFVSTLLIGLAYKDNTGTSVFQITPVEILFMLLIAGAFSETGLGFEAASPDILKRPPQSLKYGVFTPEFLADLAAYGILMAICILSSFVAVIFGMYDGNFGVDCNRRYSTSCDGVFRARSTSYTVMMWMFLFYSWQLVDARRSFLDGFVPDTKAWALRLWRNQVLFWSVVGGSVLVLPTLYIPGLDRTVFLHEGIDKEWGVVFGATIFFFVGAEAWKWAKRVYLRRRDPMLATDIDLTDQDLEKMAFERLMKGEERNQGAV
ncbi:hypothetical protein BROUX41_001919 [Berkeleyomyces rouxiae]|uniref:uncharacterized protein n=1 Tax=Berkeleyomyces rouxiae TaxID=2035830 RepID=UPI003B7C12C7